MNSAPLKKLIKNRGFDEYQSGLCSRYEAYQLTYELVYRDIDNKPAMSLSFQNETQIGHITVFISGECEMIVSDRTSKKVIFSNSCVFRSEQEFFEGYPKLVIFMRDESNT